MSYLMPKPHIQTGDIITQGGRLPLTIKKWGRVEVYSRQTQETEEKGALYFNETKKYLIVNETQTEQIAAAMGSETLEDWIGKKIVLVVKDVKVGGTTKKAIRVEKFIGWPVLSTPAPAAPVSQNGTDNPSVSQNGNGPEKPPADPNRYTSGIGRSREELWSLFKELGIDGEQAADIVRDCGGDVTAAYDKMLKDFADWIFRAGTTEGVE